MPHAGGINDQNCTFSDLMYFTGMYLEFYGNLAAGSETQTSSAKVALDEGEFS